MELDEKTLCGWIQGLRIAVGLIPEDEARRVYPEADLNEMVGLYERNFGSLDVVGGQGLSEAGENAGGSDRVEHRKLKNFDAWKQDLKSTDPVLRAAYTSSCEVGFCPARNFCQDLHVPLPCKDRWDMWAGSTQEETGCK